MISLGAKVDRISAAVGPCIGRRSYEVDHVSPNAAADDTDNDRFLSEGPNGKPHFDLEAYVVARLAAAGFGGSRPRASDTYVLEDRFYSYRRAPIASSLLMDGSSFDLGWPASALHRRG